MGRPATAALLALALAPAHADTGEDRVEVAYHRYEGGGVTSDGPALFVRKTLEGQYAVTAGYRLDMVSGTAIDLAGTDSPTEEDRHQYDLGLEHVRGKVSYGLDFTHGRDADSESTAARFSVSQLVFADLTKISLTFGVGWDDVYRRGDDSFREDAYRRIYGIDISQVVTPRLVAGLSWDTITEEGYLNNPYRSVRYRDPASATGYAFQPERYPRTRTGSAVAVRARYQFPYRFAVHGEYRFYSDDWDVRAHTLEVGYAHGFGDRWRLEARYRFHTQEGADFYSDLFPRRDFQPFLARDMSLSTMTSQTLGVGLGYEFETPWLDFLGRSAVRLSYDVVLSDYDDFRDLRFTGDAAGTEPLYSFDASIVQLVFSGGF